MTTSLLATPPLPLIIFLDFDGVLHHFFPLPDVDPSENNHFHFLPYFEAMMRELDCEVVISSTWRKKYSLEEMRAHFSEDVRHKVIGVTPSVGTGNGYGARETEVLAYLEQTGQTDRAWVGVDDYPELYLPGSAVVACMDKFDEHEQALLREAAQDPKAFAEKYPVPGTRPTDLKVVTLGK